MSNLLDKQMQFSRMLPKLFTWCFENGYEITCGEIQRGKALAEQNAANKIGIKNSLHLLSLAIDIHLFKAGIYLNMSEDYRPAGEFWKQLGGSWGGDFQNADGNHFSLSYNGVR